MTDYHIAAATCPRWAPAIHFSERVRRGDAAKIFTDRAPARFEAPAISFSAPEALMVTGDRFVVVAEQGGLVPGSTYLNAEYAWCGLLAPNSTVLSLPERTMLVLGNRAWPNYYHWLFQCLAPAAVALEAGVQPDFGVLVPPLDAVRRDSLALCGIGADRIVELPADAVAMIERGVHSRLTTGDYAFAPHPALIAAFEQMAGTAPRSIHAGERVYVARSDAGNRRMVNEPELSAALEQRGFRVVLTSALPLAEQIALFRDARAIVSPHGAGLTNLLFAIPGGTGPAIIELHQENYLHLAFLKICQAKGLRYHSVVSPMIDPGPDGRHGSIWAADIPLVLTVVDGL